MHAEAQTIAGMEARAEGHRGAYGELDGKVNGERVGDVLKRFADALPEAYVEFDSKKRGDAVNHDLYAYDAERGLAVVQVRHAWRPSRNAYLNVRKTYFLVGFTEIGNPFRHPVGHGAVNAAVRKAPDDQREIVDAAQRWIFQCTRKQLEKGVRQGDVLMIPSRKPSDEAERVGDRMAVDDGSHEIRAAEIKVEPSGEIRALEPSLHHLKGQHDPVYASDVDGWWSVRLGREARTYDFAERLGD